jgi:hypothetical protein
MKKKVMALKIYQYKTHPEAEMILFYHLPSGFLSSGRAMFHFLYREHE